MSKKITPENMTPQDAVNILLGFLEAYDNCYHIVQAKLGKSEFVTQEYYATKFILKEYLQLRQDLVILSCESVKREKELAKLEMTVKALLKEYDILNKLKTHPH